MLGCVLLCDAKNSLSKLRLQYIQLTNPAAPMISWEVKNRDHM